MYHVTTNKLPLCATTGAVITGPGAAKFSDLTDGAAAVIPEVLAGQILSLARRGDGGAGYTVLAASGDDNSLARDRLVVLLQPALADKHGGEGDDLSDGNGDGRGRRVGDKKNAAARNGQRRSEQEEKKNTREESGGGGGRPVVSAADERPRHALVIPCLPGQVRKSHNRLSLLRDQ